MFLKVPFRLMRFLILIMTAAALGSCSSKSEYPGYKKSKSGVFFKLVQLGDEPGNPSPGDFITIDIQYLTIRDSVFFKGRRKLQVQQPVYAGSIDDCFMMMKPGEKAEFIIDAKPFFSHTLQSSIPSFLEGDSKMKLRIHIIELQTSEDYENEKQAFLKWIEDFGEYEREILNQFIAREKFNIEPTVTGLYKLQLEKGAGKRVEIGDTVIVHYEGRFLDGRFFDSTRKRDEPFGFVYGTEWQVVEGLEEAIGSMQAGERALFILPSELAFGEQGSSTGIVPPYTSVIFEVELLEVK